MKIKSIYIDGLHNAVNETYEFGDIVYLFGHNGAGKSTVLQAIQFALLGYIPGTAKNSKEALLRHSPKGEISVRLTLDDVVIERRVSGGGNKLTTTPADYDIYSVISELELPIFNFNEFVGQTANKLKEYFIKHILPTADGELNWNKILTESTMDCNFTDRQSILDYGMSVVSDLEGGILDQVVQANAKFKEEQSFNKSELQRLQNTVDSLIYYDDYVGTTDVSRLSSDILALNILRDNLIKYNSALSASQSAKDEIDELTKRLEALGGEGEILKLNTKLSQLKQYHTALSEKISDKNNEIAKYKVADSMSDSIMSSNGVCPYTKTSCNSIIEQISTLRDESAKRKEAMADASAELGILNADLNNTLSSIHKCESDIANIQSITGKLSILKKTISDLPEKPNTDKTVEELTGEVDRLNDNLTKLKANIKYNETIESITNLKYEAELKGNALSKWVKVTDTNGLQTTLMIKPFEELADKMTEYIQQMYRNTDLKAHFNISTKANSFSFGIVRDGNYIIYDQLSSGEKCLYALALMICITDNNKSPLKLMLCDDMFDHLDSSTVENTFATLKSIDNIQFILAGVKDCKNAEDVMLRIG